MPVRRRARRRAVALTSLATMTTLALLVPGPGLLPGPGIVPFPVYADTPPSASPSPSPSPAPPTPCPPAEVHPSLTEPKPGDVYLRSGAAGCDRIEIEAVGRGLAGVFTVSFALRYPAELLRYEGYATGGMLAQGTPRTPPLYLVRTPSPGIVAVTMTRFAPDGAVGSEGDATFLSLRFGRIAAGAAAIDFEGGAAGASGKRILGAAGETVAARFGPGHGVAVTLP